MTNLPITRMTLYKHGVGFFERRVRLNGEEVELSFHVEAMNDVLKSLTAIDRGGGQVLGIDYATPRNRKERLAACAIRLDNDRSLRDLLVGLRGRRVQLLLDQGEGAVGTLLGLDEAGERHPLATSLVSLLMDESAQVKSVSLGRVEGVEILDDRGARDLQFFLDTSLSQEDYRQVTIRLSPGEHDLSVSYIAPAPTWRVSYRLVADRKASGSNPQALLQGWGIFDNRLEEDLRDISLSLVAGMPISFVYDLYKPFTPKRPVVEEEARVAAAPAEFVGAGMADAEELSDIMADLGEAPATALEEPALGQTALAQAVPVTTRGESLGELFQYVIGTPVTVGRGQSAMVPIISADLGYHKDLLYNGSKMPNHPVATLRLNNDTGLTLERGPVTVIEGGEYVGEAILPFTVAGGEVTVPHAVELGVKVREESGSTQEIRELRIKGVYLQFEEWQVLWREYQLNNSTGQPHRVLVEHRRLPQFERFDTPDPKEQTDEHFRFEVEVPPQGEATLRVNERSLVTRQEKLHKQTSKALKDYLAEGLMDRRLYDGMLELLELWQNISDNEQRLKDIDQERQKIYKAQQQVQGNMGALSTTGKEGALRTRYVKQLEASEEQLKALGQRESDLKSAIEKLRKTVEDQIKTLGEKGRQS